jgi:hypothetical protein
MDGNLKARLIRLCIESSALVQKLSRVDARELVNFLPEAKKEIH